MSVSVAVIVVNYGTADLALAAVDSVLVRQHDGCTVEVHLVDNASPGDDAARLTAAVAERGWSDRVTLHLEAENHGFGRGNNLVFSALAKRPEPPRYVFMLNPDARLENEAIGVLAGFLNAHPDVGIAGAALQRPGDGPSTAAFRFPTIIGSFAELANFGPVTRLLSRWRIPLAPDHGTGPVDWVSGAAFLARFDLIRQLDGFGPEFFLYYEEVDLMKRVSELGWQTWLVQEARVLHEEGAATEVNSHRAFARRKPAYWYESWYLYFSRNHRRPYLRLAVLATLTGALLNLAQSAIRRRPVSIPQRFLRDFWAVAGRPAFGLPARRYDLRSPDP